MRWPGIPNQDVQILLGSGNKTLAASGFITHLSEPLAGEQSAAKEERGTRDNHLTNELSFGTHSTLESFAREGDEVCVSTFSAATDLYPRTSNCRDHNDLLLLLHDAVCKSRWQIASIPLNPSQR